MPSPNNGQEIVFTTSEALSPDDGNGAPDVYLWKNGHTSLISTGSVGGGAGSGVIDGSGTNIYFNERPAAHAGRHRQVSDVYDARIDGGFSFKELAPLRRRRLPAGQHARARQRPTPATDAGRGARQLPARHDLDQGAELVAAGEARRRRQGRTEAEGERARQDLAQGHGPDRQEVSSRSFAATSRAVQAGVVNVPISLSRARSSQLRKSGVAEAPARRRVRRRGAGHRDADPEDGRGKAQALEEREWLR